MGNSIDEEEEEEEAEEEEEDYEDGGGGNRFLGFMFGNVDNSGDLDVDYLDEDAKEHLGALADKLGSSLTEIDLSVKSPRLSADAAEQDYDEKADDAVDYEDIDEQYEGPEVQAAGEEDHLLPKKDYFSSQVSVGQLDTAPFPFDDENYDEIEEEEVEKEDLVMDKLEMQDISLSGQQDVAAASSDQQILSDGVQPRSATEQIDSDLEGLSKEEVDALEGPVNGKDFSPLPVLCIEDGLVILRFSEIFGMHEPVKKDGKRDHRYYVLRDKYRNMDIVEEDEEAFMKSSSQVISFRPHLIQQPTTATYDTGSESVTFGSREDDVKMSVQSKEQRLNCCSSSEPFNMDLTVDLAEELQPEFSTKFYPLDQQDWEDRIVWDNSPAVSDNSMECYDIAPGSSISSIKETEVGSGPPDFHVELLTNSDEKDCQSFVHSSSVVGSFSEDSLDSQKISSSERTFHPQLLRLEYWPEVDQSDLVDSGEKAAVEPCKSDALRRFDKLTLRNRNLMEGYWLDDIVWEPNSVMVKPKLILDLQDEQMLFELLDHEESELLQLHAGAVIVSHSPTPMVSFDGFKKGWQFNIANDEFYVNGNVSRQLQSSSSKRTTYGIKVHHSAAAIKLETMKLKLSNKDLANFHRPRAMWYPHNNGVAVKEQWKLPTLGSMKIILKSLGGKGSKLHVDADETVSSVKVKASKKLDFKPSEVVKLYYLGKELEDSKSLVAQNVQPNSLLHLVRTKVHLMPRAQKIPRENKSLRPPSAFKKKSDLSVRDGHV